MKATTISLNSRLTNEQIELLRFRLEAYKNELMERVTRLDQSSRRALSADSGERAVELEDSEVRQALLREGEDELSKILACIERIKQGGYGFCICCGEQIGWPRLQAKPHALRCIKCRESLDDG
ncbi:MAG: TraR/DksA family transcriptional regulator [Pseudomonadota bacterium]